MHLCSMACRSLVLAAVALHGDSQGPETVKINTDEGTGPKGNNSSNSLNMMLFITYLMVEQLPAKINFKLSLVRI